MTVQERNAMLKAIRHPDTPEEVKDELMACLNHEPEQPAWPAFDWARFGKPPVDFTKSPVADALPQPGEDGIAE